MKRFSKHTLLREYKRRPDGNYEKAVEWRGDGTECLRKETIVRDSAGRMLRVERKRDRS